MILTKRIVLLPRDERDEEAIVHTHVGRNDKKVRSVTPRMLAVVFTDLKSPLNPFKEERI